MKSKPGSIYFRSFQNQSINDIKIEACHAVETTNILRAEANLKPIN